MNDMVYIEYILAVLLVLTYIVVFKWLLSTVLIYILDISRYTADWFSYTAVVIITPILLLYLFNYEITPLAMCVFAIYSAYWLWGRVYKRAFYLF